MKRSLSGLNSLGPWIIALRGREITKAEKLSDDFWKIKYLYLTPIQWGGTIDYGRLSRNFIEKIFWIYAGQGESENEKIRRRLAKHYFFQLPELNRSSLIGLRINSWKRHSSNIWRDLLDNGINNFMATFTYIQPKKNSISLLPSTNWTTGKGNKKCCICIGKDNDKEAELCSKVQTDGWINTAYLFTERKCEMVKHTVLTSSCVKWVENIWIS